MQTESRPLYREEYKVENTRILWSGEEYLHKQSGTA